MKKPVRVKYAPAFEAGLEALRSSAADNKFNQQLLKAIEREKDSIKANPHRGIQVQKRLIPQEYIEKYGITNLWKINLPDFWRMLYTITGTEIEIIAIMLEFMNHKSYDKKFGYRKK